MKELSMIQVDQNNVSVNVEVLSYSLDLSYREKRKKPERENDFAPAMKGV